MSESSFNKVVDLINAENQPIYPLTDEVIELTDLTADAEPAWNTKLTVRAIPGHGYKDQVDIFYRRVNLSVLGTTIGLMQEEPFTISSLLTQLNLARTHAGIEEDDLDPITIPEMESGTPVDLVISANNASFAWLGNTTLQIAYGVPETASSLHYFMNVTLPDFYRM